MTQTKPKIALLLDSLGPSQLAMEITHCLANQESAEVIVFVHETTLPPFVPTFPVMPMLEFHGYRFDIALATSVSTGKVLQKVKAHPGAKKLLYVNDYEWTHSGPNPWSAYAGLYQDPTLEIVCPVGRGDFFSKCWNRSVQEGDFANALPGQ